LKRRLSINISVTGCSQNVYGFEWTKQNGCAIIIAVGEYVTDKGLQLRFWGERIAEDLRLYQKLKPHFLHGMQTNRFPR
jgi:hypothetical protein